MGRGKVTRRDANWWSPLNKAYREYIEEHGEKPGRKWLDEWMIQNADATWPNGDAPSTQHAWDHCKCLRTLDQARDYFRAYRARKKDEREALRDDWRDTPLHGSEDGRTKKRSSYDMEGFAGDPADDRMMHHGGPSAGTRRPYRHFSSSGRHEEYLDGPEPDDGLGDYFEGAEGYRGQQGRPPRGQHHYRDHAHHKSRRAPSASWTTEDEHMEGTDSEDTHSPPGAGGRRRQQRRHSHAGHGPARTDPGLYRGSEQYDAGYPRGLSGRQPGLAPPLMDGSFVPMDVNAWPQNAMDPMGMQSRRSSHTGVMGMGPLGATGLGSFPAPNPGNTQQAVLATAIMQQQQQLLMMMQLQQMQQSAGLMAGGGMAGQGQGNDMAAAIMSQQAQLLSMMQATNPLAAAMNMGGLGAGPAAAMNLGALGGGSAPGVLNMQLLGMRPDLLSAQLSAQLPSGLQQQQQLQLRDGPSISPSEVRGEEAGEYPWNEGPAPNLYLQSLIAAAACSKAAAMQQEEQQQEGAGREQQQQLGWRDDQVHAQDQDIKEGDVGGTELSLVLGGSDRQAAMASPPARSSRAAPQQKQELPGAGSRQVDSATKTKEGVVSVYCDATGDGTV